MTLLPPIQDEQQPLLPNPRVSSLPDADANWLGQNPLFQLKMQQKLLEQLPNTTEALGQTEQFGFVPGFQGEETENTMQREMRALAGLPAGFIKGLIEIGKDVNRGLQFDEMKIVPKLPGMILNSVKDTVTGQNLMDAVHGKTTFTEWLAEDIGNLSMVFGGVELAAAKAGTLTMRAAGEAEQVGNFARAATLSSRADKIMGVSQKAGVAAAPYRFLGRKVVMRPFVAAAERGRVLAAAGEQQGVLMSTAGRVGTWLAERPMLRHEAIEAQRNMLARAADMYQHPFIQAQGIAAERVRNLMAEAGEEISPQEALSIVAQETKYRIEEGYKTIEDINKTVEGTRLRRSQSRYRQDPGLAPIQGDEQVASLFDQIETQYEPFKERFPDLNQSGRLPVVLDELSLQHTYDIDNIHVPEMARTRAEIGVNQQQFFDLQQEMHQYRVDPTEQVIPNASEAAARLDAELFPGAQPTKGAVQGNLLDDLAPEKLRAEIEPLAERERALSQEYNAAKEEFDRLSNADRNIPGRNMDELEKQRVRAENAQALDLAEQRMRVSESEMRRATSEREAAEAAVGSGYIKVGEGAAPPPPPIIPGPTSSVRRIISGGQTGADIGGLRAGKSLGMETGGTAPQGFRTDAGPNTSLRDTFGLDEHSSRNYRPRTKKNVDDADATIVFRREGVVSKGSQETIDYAEKTGKPVKVIDTDDPAEAARQVREFVDEHKPTTLNIAGHRERSLQGIGRFVERTLQDAFRGSQPIEQILEGVPQPALRYARNKNKTIKWAQFSETIDQVLEGNKTMTTRTSKLGNKGEVLKSEAGDIVIENVDEMPLEEVAHNHYADEGFKSPKEFIETWKKLHNGSYDPNQTAFVHRFRRKGEEEVIGQMTPEQIVKESYRHGGDIDPKLQARLDFLGAEVAPLQAKMEALEREIRELQKQQGGGVAPVPETIITMDKRRVETGRVLEGPRSELDKLIDAKQAELSSLRRQAQPRLDEMEANLNAQKILRNASADGYEAGRQAEILDLEDLRQRVLPAAVPLIDQEINRLRAGGLPKRPHPELETLPETRLFSDGALRDDLPKEAFARASKIEEALQQKLKNIDELKELHDLHHLAYQTKALERMWVDDEAMMASGYDRQWLPHINEFLQARRAAAHAFAAKEIDVVTWARIMDEIPNNWTAFMAKMEELGVGKEMQVLDEVTGEMVTTRMPPPRIADFSQNVVSSLASGRRHLGHAFVPGEVLEAVNDTLAEGQKPILPPKPGRKVSAPGRFTSDPENLLRNASRGLYGSTDISPNLFVAQAMEPIWEQMSNQLADYVNNAHFRVQLPEGAEIPRGFVKWSEDVDQFGKKTISVVPQGVQTELSRFATVGPNNAIMRGSAQMLDAMRVGVLHFSPKWLVNNALGNIFLAALEQPSAVFNMRNWIDALESAKKKGYLADGTVIELRHASTPSEVIEAAEFKGELGRDLAGNIEGEGIRRVSEAPVIKWVVDKTANLNSGMDQFARALLYKGKVRKLVKQRAKGTFLKDAESATGFRWVKDDLIDADALFQHIEDGNPLTPGEMEVVEQANREAIKAMVDYGNMSPWERTYVRRFIPFYTWQKNIAKLALSLPLDHPLRFATIEKISEHFGGFSKEERDTLPEYLIPSFELPGLNGRISSRGMNPLQDAFQLFRPDGEGFRESANPFLTAAMRFILHAKKSPFGAQEVGPGGFTQQVVGAGGLFGDLVKELPPIALAREVVGGLLGAESLPLLGDLRSNPAAATTGYLGFTYRPGDAVGEAEVRLQQERKEALLSQLRVDNPPPPDYKFGSGEEFFRSIVKKRRSGGFRPSSMTAYQTPLLPLQTGGL